MDWVSLYVLSWKLDDFFSKCIGLGISKVNCSMEEGSRECVVNTYAGTEYSSLSHFDDVSSTSCVVAQCLRDGVRCQCPTPLCDFNASCHHDAMMKGLDHHAHRPGSIVRRDIK